MINISNTTIGFVGTGVMGNSMAGHLLNAGYQLNVFTRTKDKAMSLIHAGAKWVDTIPELASSSDVIITMVGYPNDVEEIYLGQDGIISSAKKGSHLIDMTTSSPQLAITIYDTAKDKELYALDAPVSGGDVGAKNAKLTIMVGGDEEPFEAVKPLFEIMGSNIVLQGKAGAGQHTKMCNQIAIATNMIGVCEAIAYAKKAGLEPQKVLQSIESGAAGSWSLSNLGKRMMNNNFEPGFYVKHFIKDMTIAMESAEKMNLYAPGLKLSKGLYDKLASQGNSDKGTQALFKLFE